VHLTDAVPIWVDPFLLALSLRALVKRRIQA